MQHEGGWGHPPFRSTDELLVELVTWAQRIAAGEPLRRVRCTLHVQGLASVSGVVVGLGGPQQQSVVLDHLDEPGHAGRPGEDLSFIARSALVGISLHGLQALAPATLAAAPVPTRLELKRALVQVADALRADLGLGVETSLDDALDEPRLTHAMAMLRDLPAALAALSRHSAKKTMLQQQLRRLRVLSSAEAAVSLAQGALDLHVPPLIQPRLNREQIEAAIDHWL